MTEYYLFVQYKSIGLGPDWNQGNASAVIGSRPRWTARSESRILRPRPLPAPPLG
jgi:hypothetical protein